ncbi:helix-turn-helix domain-containing protein [Streptomyces sp. NPDC050982]|uniref:helix-turn-helix domain-containing protein n=1 Tax=Streptomyces sp. NPDC050982 TaxID=3154746 RepID=UPI0033F50D75
MTTHPPEAATSDLDLLIFSAFTEVISGEGRWSEQTAARIRAEGRAWAARGEPVEELLSEVRAMTWRLLNRPLAGRSRPDPLAHEALALRLGDAARRVAHELNSGYFEEVTTTTAPLPSGHRPTGPAAAYAVLAIQAPDHTATALGDAVRRHAGDGVVVLHSDSWVNGVNERSVHVLVPAESQKESVELARRVHPDLDGDAWIAVHWQLLTEVPGAGTVVEDICATLLAIALAGPPGVYELDDVLVHYGVAETPAVSRRLVEIIERLPDQPVLWETLNAFIAANGAHHRAAEQLGILGDTLDRRLERITWCTGHRTDTLHGLATLSAALVAYTVTRRERP